MFKYFKWQIAALPILAIPMLAMSAQASEPPSTKVARWQDKLCPRDMTPQVTSPLYGYYPTRWRMMPADLVLHEELAPPAVAPKKGVVPSKGAVPPKGINPSQLNGADRSGSPIVLPTQTIDLRRVMPVKGER
jgi:hypothetical protein